MKKTLSLFVLFAFSSCIRDYYCDCKTIRGCKTIRFVKASDSSLLEKRTLCRFVYFPYDSAYLDTIKKMKYKYDSLDSPKIAYRVLVSDSIYKKDSVYHIKSNETKKYYDSAYICNCLD